MSKAKNPTIALNELYNQFAAGTIDRRTLMLRAGGLGLAAATLARFERAVPAHAQDATPAATGQVINSITREEFKAQLMEWWTAYEEPASTGGQVIYGENASSNMSTYLFMLGADHPTNTILNMVQETLVGSSPIDGQYVPFGSLADRWEIAADGKTYTFFLNPNATWHDGTPFTAADCDFSFAAQADPTTGSSYTAQFTDSVASWEIVDDRTFRVVAADVLAPVVFLGNSFCPIIPKHIWESVPKENWASDGGANGQDPARVVGTGPFKFQGADAGAGTSTYVKNPDYYDQVPVIDEFVFTTWPDDTALVEALRAGNVDFVENIPPADVESLQVPDQGTDVKIYDTYSFSWFGYNLDPAKTPLFQDVKTRQALFYGLDRDSMVANIMLGYAEVAQGSQPTLSIAYAPDRITTKYTYDPARATALLAEAGWADSDGDGILEKDGQKLSFEIMYGSGSATSDQIVAYMQEAWKAIGVEATPSAIDFATVLVPALTENFDYQMVLLGFNWDATADQSAMFSTDNYKAGFNAMKYSNPRVDELFDLANRELDDAKRVDLLVEAANIVNEDLPVGILWFRKDRTAYQTRIRNFEPNGPASIAWWLPYGWIQQ